jgi:hypothetical protein
LPPSVIFVASASTRNPKANHRIEPMQLDAKTTLPKASGAVILMVAGGFRLKASSIDCR